MLVGRCVHQAIQPSNRQDSKGLQKNCRGTAKRPRATIGAAFLGTRGRRRKFGRTDLFRNREAKRLSQQDQMSRTSALGQKADISRRNRHVRFDPESDTSMECPPRTTSRRQQSYRSAIPIHMVGQYGGTSVQRDFDDCNPSLISMGSGWRTLEVPMSKMATVGATALFACILCATPSALRSAPEGSVSLFGYPASAVIGRPLPPGSVAGVNRRVHRRAYRRGYYGNYGYGYGTYRPYGYGYAPYRRYYRY